MNVKNELNEIEFSTDLNNNNLDEEQLEDVVLTKSIVCDTTNDNKVPIEVVTTECKKMPTTIQKKKKNSVELLFDFEKSKIYTLKNILACLTKNERKAIDLKRKQKEKEITTRISHQDLESIEPTQELKTPVIDVVVNGLRKKPWWFGDEYEFCFFSVMFFTALTNHSNVYKYCYDNVKRWSLKENKATKKPKWLKIGKKYRKEDCVFLYKYALIPICKLHHYYLWIANFKKRQIIALDSLGSDHNADGKIILQYLEDEYAHHWKENSDVSVTYNKNNWSIHTGKSNHQNNAVDCGVFVCAHMMLFTMGHQLPLPITPKSTMNFRKFLQYLCIHENDFGNFGSCPICHDWYTDISDVDAMECDNCFLWCHIKCIEEEEEVHEGDGFLCKNCCKK